LNRSKLHIKKYAAYTARPDNDRSVLSGSSAIDRTMLRAAA
jgi:hypothetical protein